MEDEQLGADAPDRVMDEQRKEQMAGIKDRVARGEYSVDHAAVADAILRRIGFPRAALEPWPSAQKAQNECSYPDSCSPDGPKLTPASPARTEPIQVRPSRSLSLRALVSALWPAVGGTQTQSS
jgi:hypothetical protein